MLTLEGHSGTVRCLDLNGNRLVSGSTDRTIKVWDLSFASYWSGASCKVTMVGHFHTVRCLQVCVFMLARVVLSYIGEILNQDRLCRNVLDL